MTQSLDIINLDSNQAYRVSTSEFVVGRGRETDLAILDPEFSRRQFRIIKQAENYLLEGLSDSVPTYCDDQLVDRQIILEQGMQIRAGRTCFLVRFERQKTAPKLAATATSEDSFPVSAATIVPSSGERDEDLSGELSETIPIGKNAVLGRASSADVYLPQVQVSREHARIYQRKNVPYIQDLGSANGTFVDGEPVSSPRPLKIDSIIGIGPYSLTYLGDKLVPVSRTNNSQLEADELTCRVPDKDHPGEKITILDKVSLVIRPREFICLLGPSGAGKSTLLSALSARTPATSGCVLVNGLSLYENFESLKSEVAVVPQRDILHESLTVEDALRFTARLRLPADTSAEEIDKQIDELLVSVGLVKQRSQKICLLSGGQRRRASLANELISDPSLLFLDEVTSGLDEESDREMMQLFRRLADSGKTVVCVTHTLVNVPANCHLVAFLTVGGKLAYFGSPQGVLQEFGIDRLGAMYKQLEDPAKIDQLQKEALKSPSYQQFVTERVSKNSVAAAKENVVIKKHYWNRQWRTFAAQSPILLRRYWKVFCADWQAIVGLFLQCFVVAAVLFLVFGNVGDPSEPAFRRATLTCNVLFVLAISSFWFGCNNSAKEIVKERGIYTKELQANLDPNSYYFSKFLLQLGIVSLQSVLLLCLVTGWCGLPGNLLEQFGILIAGGTAGIAIGLFISSVSTSEETALTLVPLVLIPQIILSDVFIELTGFSKILGALFASNYWIYGAIRGTLPDELLEQLNSPLAPPIGMRVSMIAVGLQIVVLAVVSILVVHVRDRSMASHNRTFLQAVKELPLVRFIQALIPK